VGNVALAIEMRKGTATNAENYRPISLTCVASKIMERIISDQMASFLM